MQREIRGGFTLELAYVGRLGRHLLQEVDLAEPVNYVDPQGGGSYFANAAMLSKLVDQNGGNANAAVSPIPYFEDVFPQAANVDYMGESATQTIYSDQWAPYRYSLGETTSLSDLDFYCEYTCPQGPSSGSSSSHRSTPGRRLAWPPTMPPRLPCGIL